jgi:hypothetical protein
LSYDGEHSSHFFPSLMADMPGFNITLSQGSNVRFGSLSLSNVDADIFVDAVRVPF